MADTPLQKLTAAVQAQEALQAAVRTAAAAETEKRAQEAPKPSPKS